MAEVDPQAATDAAIQTIQNSINKLNDMIAQPGANVGGITKQMDALTSKQTELRFLELRTLEDSPANRAAITSLNDASAALNREAASIGKVATVLNDAAKVINAAATLLAALAAFTA